MTITIRSVRVILCALFLTAGSATSQTTQSPINANDGSAYGGPPITPGSVVINPPTATQKPRGGDGTSGTTVPCIHYNSLNQAMADPCVLTGQYNRSRNSTNIFAANLANFTSPSSFGLAYFYKFTAQTPNGFSYEPVVAQPLYITNVPQSSGTVNMLLAATLNDQVYAFNTDTGSQLSWSPVNLLKAAHHCNGGTPFLETSPTNSGFPGGAGLPYYGIVSTPVIDIEPTPPVAYVVSACVDSASLSSPKWFLDAIELKGGNILATQALSVSGFNDYNQLSRASLLLTHPGGAENQTDLYISFGAGVLEEGAATTPPPPISWAYSGTVFGFDVAYLGQSPWIQFTALGSSPFFTEGCPQGNPGYPCSSPFPSIYASNDDGGYPLAPLCYGFGESCSPGQNWASNGGGCWMSSKGPSSDASANVYLACGNGAFACATSTQQPQTDCTDVTKVFYWGESAMVFPAATGGTTKSMGAPVDFYAPHDQRYVCPWGATDCSKYNMPNNSSFPTDTRVTTTNPTYQTYELSRLDQDFGLSGQVLIQAGGQVFSVTSDKSGYLYVMPPSIPSQSQNLGQFKSGDVGLQNQTYSTQLPFQISRKPQIADGSYQTVCVTINDSTGIVGGNPCDEVHELLWNNDLLFVWPTNETIEVFQGSYNSTTKNYAFTTPAAFDPCSGAQQCAGFPASSHTSAGAPMALAASNSAQPYPLATLWAIVPRVTSNSNGLGTLYGYTVNGNPTAGTVGSLGSAPVWYWQSGATTNSCPTTPNNITAWFPTTHTEPTLSDNQQTTGSSVGAVYVPTNCVINDSNWSNYNSCFDAQSKYAVLLSGVPVFTSCPAQ